VVRMVCVAFGAACWSARQRVIEKREGGAGEGGSGDDKSKLLIIDFFRSASRSFGGKGECAAQACGPCSAPIHGSAGRPTHATPSRSASASWSTMPASSLQSTLAR